MSELVNAKTRNPIATTAQTLAIAQSGRLGDEPRRIVGRFPSGFP